MKPVQRQSGAPPAQGGIAEGYRQEWKRNSLIEGVI